MRDGDIAMNNLVLHGQVGSGAHGTAIEGQDDRDEMGICLEPLELVCGLSTFEHYTMRTQPEGVGSGPGDLDLIVYGLRKFCRLAAKGNPSILGLLYLPEYMVKTNVGLQLIALRDAFISRAAGNAFLGYLISQRRALSGERSKRVQRPDLVERYGYDTKFAMHALRLGLQGIEYLSTGHISIPIREPDLALVRSVREGLLSLAQTMAEIDSVEARLREIIRDFTREVDVNRVNRFLVDAYTSEGEML